MGNTVPAPSAFSHMGIWRLLGSGVWGACLAQSVQHLTLAQVMISQLMILSPTSGLLQTLGVHRND